MMKGTAVCANTDSRDSDGVGDRVVNRHLHNAVYDAEQAVCYQKEATNARLFSHPRCLYMLWKEYKFIIGVYKVAKLFIAEEYGQVKHKYWLRKIVCDTVRELIVQGWSAITSCENSEMCTLINLLLVKCYVK